MTDIIASLLLPAALKGSLVCAGVLLATLLLGRTAPSLRHLLLFMALSSFLAIPAVQLALPPLDVPSPLPAFVAMDAARHDGTSMESLVSGPARGAGDPAPVIGTLRARRAWENALLLLWAAGALVLAGRSLIAQRVLRPLRRTASPLEGPCAKEAERMTAASAARGRVGILQTVVSDIPLTFGILRPVVLLPAAMLTGARETFTAVLAHELAHVRRRDVLTGGTAYLICCLFWFTPFAWLALFRMRVEQEKSCDLAALRTAPSRARYAEMLLELRASIVRPPILARFTAQGGGGSALEERILNVLNHDARRIHVKRRIRSIVLMTVCALIVPLSMTRCAPAVPAAVPGAARASGAPAEAARFNPVWPIGSGGTGEITLAFGAQVNPITKKDFTHIGMDIAARMGVPVVASANGVVIDAGFNDEMGNYVTLSHDGGFGTSYRHLQKILVSNGGRVDAGTAIGLLGSTGQSTGPHLHYEIRSDGTVVDPALYEYTCTAAGSGGSVTVTGRKTVTIRTGAWGGQ